MKHINHIIFIFSLFIPCLSHAMLPPLHQAAYNGNLEQLRQLLINTTIEDVNAPAECGWTPLHCAAIKGNKEHVMLLLAHGANVNAVTALIKSTPLHFAAIWGDTDIAELLINNGAEINAADSDGYTPLESAKANGRENLALLLRNKGAKFGSLDDLRKQLDDLRKEIEKEKFSKSLQN